MNSKPLDVRRLDVAEFARSGREVEGTWPAEGFSRLADLESPPGAPRHEVQYAARGELRRASGGVAEPWLRLQVDTVLTLVCQRCLGALDVPLHVDRGFHFVRDEATAAELDADSEDDVLPLTRAFDLHALAEDELLMGLPLVPRHEACPDAPPLVFEADPDEAASHDEAPHPFAALAALKRKGGPG